ncbi:type II toxin-antitoxin system RelE/ParE family toxin [Epilithonimonas hungarica]|uniref:ParE toxin of type II toxin-antitoxin system, parDE n=1 Tax=Epilithonimonas hungarica TaxID=454006 RepID=A0A1G7VBJ9_9FLAO|nr:type II toxin-antitoxin system RelE/ParE family toxin [Epilithonimonas hungarica]SDG57192.1 ParE toxin of type II toxin-antitoxin system, parDE [Epilithonimonas hungarica]
MNCRIEFSAFVKTDLKEIDDWYRKINKKLLLRFYEEFENEVKFLRENPLSKEKKYNDCRICYLKDFPFGIHYKYDDLSNSILIIGIYHTSRNPKIWQTRL